MRASTGRHGEPIKNFLQQRGSFNPPMMPRHAKVKKKQTGWVGDKVHCTEGCDAEQPYLILEVTTTAATLPDGEVMEDLHERLAENKVLPATTWSIRAMLMPN